MLTHATFEDVRTNNNGANTQVLEP